MLRLQHRAGRQHDLARGHVFAGKSAVGAKLQAFRHGDGIAIHRHVFLHEDRVGALGHRRAGENPDGFAGFQRHVGARAGGQPAADRKPGIGIGFEIGVAHRVSVHRRIIERRQIDRRLDVGGDDAAARAVELYPFGLGYRRDALADQPLHLVERHQRAGKGETVVGELRH